MGRGAEHRQCSETGHADRTQGSEGASGKAQDIPRLSLSHSGLLLTDFFWTKLCSFKRESEGCDM